MPQVTATANRTRIQNINSHSNQIILLAISVKLSRYFHSVAQLQIEANSLLSRTVYVYVAYN